MLLALSRARRFGPVIAEPLPTVVPAAETVMGRGRMYRRSGARTQAAIALRAGTYERLRQRCGLPRGVALPALIDEVVRMTGRSPGEVSALLAGSPPGSDAELIELAQHLRSLEKELP
jgi:hypothetical protein